MRGPSVTSLVLGLDTAGPTVGVALWENGASGSWSTPLERGTERILVPAIRDVLGGRRPDAVAVATGPGTFTGVRVGVATALGLARAWGCPVAALSSLAVRAALAAGEPRVLALLDARKERYYAGLYDTRDPVPQPLDEECDVPFEALLRWLPAVCAGDGALLEAKRLEAAGGRIHPRASGHPAVEAARLGALALASGRTTDPAQVRIRYIRPPDATPPVGGPGFDNPPGPS
ncbi:MAG: tRNA (adenosine(37)-N6)-threonylcarbamoyltransferase complex dimerization subunit type 1 TsaB [Deltaproteobacteria bacterium]|nr:tRNA (adenosine(37)-N6)-threonylcarbamoyltransferase complex dimerization subunit type 1 TsaB [Deltaproteobacteria bacterium]